MRPWQRFMNCISLVMMRIMLGKVRRLPDGAMQMFIRDPAGNLVEITCPPDYPVAERVFADEVAESGDGILYKSGREDGRGDRGEGASLYHDD